MSNKLILKALIGNVYLLLILAVHQALSYYCSRAKDAPGHTSLSEPLPPHPNTFNMEASDLSLPAASLVVLTVPSTPHPSFTGCCY